MRFLVLMNKQPLDRVARLLSKIRLPVKKGEILLSLIDWIVGDIDGMDEEEIRAMADFYHEVMIASSKDTTFPNERAMSKMVAGQAFDSAMRIQSGTVDSTEETLLAAFSTGRDDFFVRDSELFNRMRRVYTNVLGAVLEDFNYPQATIVYGELVPRQSSSPDLIFKSLYNWQRRMVNDRGHHNFFDQSMRTELAREFFRVANNRSFDRNDFLLTGAVMTMPVVVVPEFEDARQTPLDELSSLTGTRPIFLRVAMERYEKMRYLLRYVLKQPVTSTYERYRRRRNEFLPDMDMSSFQSTIQSLYVQRTGTSLPMDSYQLVEDYARYVVGQIDPHTNLTDPSFYKVEKGIPTGAFANLCSLLDTVLQHNFVYQKLLPNDKLAVYDAILDLLKTELYEGVV